MKTIEVNRIWNTKLTQTLSPHSIQIWKVVLPLSQDLMNRLITNLNDEEIQRAHKFHSKSDRDIYICARGALRELLALYLNINPKIIYFNYNPYGKPYLEKTNLQFNISHSRHCILLAFSLNNPIGVDIEYYQKSMDFLSIAKDFFTENEYQKLLILSPEERKLAFYRCWTRKEAILKAMGNGLSISTKRIEVSLLSGENVNVLNLNLDNSQLEDWELLEIIPKDNYIGAMAIKRKNNLVLLQDWNKCQEELLTNESIFLSP